MKTSMTILFGIVVFMVGAFSSADTLTVGPGGGYDFVSIQAAIEAAVDDDEIEVAPGVYFEAIDFLGKAVRLYSSHGAETTTLDGTGHYHVVQCVSGEGAGTILEGFTITGGNADGAWPNNHGGGMFILSSSPTVSGCVFAGNSAALGGGGLGTAGLSNPVLLECVFVGNTAGQYGGGLCTFSGGSPLLVDCTFSENSGQFGGGFFNAGAPTLIGCTFSGNAAAYGGGMYNEDGASLVHNSAFSGNTAEHGGGGMYNFSGSAAVTASTFTANATQAWGGGLSNWMCDLTLDGCVFSANTAARGGGGVFTDTGDTVVVSSLFTANHAASGGAMELFEGSPSVVNCTFYANTADRFGGAIYNQPFSSPAVSNSILWANTATTGPQMHGGTPLVSYSTIAGAVLWPGAGNLQSDPLFVDAAAGNFRLRRGSPCIDAGNNTALPAAFTADLNGWPRRIDDLCAADTGVGPAPVVDMGAYEFLPADFDSSGTVDLTDLFVLVADWLTDVSNCCGADINGDGRVDMEDLSLLAAYWLGGL